MKPAIVCPNCGHRILPNLNDRQQRVFDAVRSSHGSRGYSPTIAELAHRLKIPEPTVKKDIDALVRKNLLQRPFHGARNLFLVPEAQQPARKHLRAVR